MKIELTDDALAPGTGYRVSDAALADIRRALELRPAIKGALEPEEALAIVLELIEHRTTRSNR